MAAIPSNPLKIKNELKKVKKCDKSYKCEFSFSGLLKGGENAYEKIS